jgi:hypothetical protein
MNKPVVLIATPCFGGLVSQNYVLSITRLMSCIGGQIDLSLMLLGNDALITRSRATLVGKFLDNPQATHLMFIDSDIGFEPEQFARLFRAGKAFSAALYPIKEFDWERVPQRQAQGESLLSAGLNYVGTLCSGAELAIQEGFATARYVGTGFQLIRREVFERMMQEYPELKYRKIHAQDPSTPSGRHLYAFFDPLIDPETGEYLSEDYAFCKRWRDIGGDIWVDLHSKLRHVGSNDYCGDSALRYRDYMVPQPACPSAGLTPAPMR